MNAAFSGTEGSDIPMLPNEPDNILDVAESTAERLAARHYGECYDSEICAYCIDDTPLSAEWGPWIGKKSEFDELVEQVREDYTDAGGDGDGGFIEADLAGVYFEAFDEAASAPEDCVVCTARVVDLDEPCGHQLEGHDCPLRDG